MKEKIQAKLNELAQEKEQAVAQFNAILGAEQVLQQMLEELDKEENTPRETRCSRDDPTESKSQH